MEKKSYFVVLILAAAIAITNCNADVALAGSKWKKAIGIGIAVGVGAAIVNDMRKKKKARKNAQRKNSGRRRLSREKVREIQYALNDLGFNSGTPDGIMGRGTRSAIRQFKISIGANATGRLTPDQINMLLGGGTAVAATRQSMTVSYAGGCSNPMSPDQLQRVIAKFRTMAPDGDGFKIDRCRNITIRYGDSQKTGKLHQLFTELNGSHHDTTYYGLISKGEWWVYGSGGQIYLADQNKASKQMSADWMMRYNRETVELLKMAGYETDPNATKRKEILKRDFEALGRPDFGENLRALSNLMQRYGGGSSGATGGSNSKSPSNGSTATTVSSGTPRGVKTIQKWGKSPTGEQMHKVFCTTRPSAIYYWRNGEWYHGLVGAAGHSRKSLDQLAKYHCGG